MLFGIAPLVGIAKMAAESPRLEAKRRVDYFEISARSYLSRCPNPNLPFRWTINPYRGCEFGCQYCYARYTHEFMELRDPRQFETSIYAKQFDPKLFQREIEKLPGGESIALGTATDPYQPAERRFEVTRRMLEVFARTSGRRLGITTKSDLILRDRDLLVEIARRHRLGISITITTADIALARRLEPMAPRPDLRFHAVRELRDAGLRVRVSCAPIMPLINDSEGALDALIHAAKKARALGVWANVLFLKPCAYQVFLPFLEQNFPHLVRRYRERFSHSAYLRGAYPELIRERVANLCQRYGLGSEGEDASYPELWPTDAQMSLF